tara:strand:+ start:2668 stop:6672 length:4005 start_codon:yes stop_codon:yes gene_type:complete
MKDPSEYSNLGEDFVLDEQERQTQLSNEQVQEIQQRLEAPQEELSVPEQNAAQAAMAAQAEPQGETSAPSTGGPVDTSPYKDAEGNIDLDQIRKEGQELDQAVLTGVADFAADAINFFLPDGMPQVPKVTPYENKVASITRSISSVLFPTLATQGLGMGLAKGAQALSVNKLGAANKLNQLGNTAFMKFVGSRGIEAGAGVAVGSISSEYEEDNLAGQLKQSFPKTFDFIPDNWATLAGDSPDIKRQKSINEDLGLGFMIPMVGFAGKFVNAVSEVKDVFKTAPKIVGESDQAVKYLAANRPKPTSDVPEEALLEYQAKQDEALDELGYYNASKTTDPNVAIKGVHDLYDFRETGVRTVDDLGIVGASIDAARIQGNKGTVYGRLGNFISGPALKYGAETPGGVEDITLGLAQQLKKADKVGMVADDFTVSADEVAEAADNLVLELFDPSASIADMRRMLDPEITKNEFGVEVLSQQGYADALSSVNTLVKEFKGIDIARAQAYTATSMAGQIADLSEGMRLNRGSISIEQAQEQVLDKINFLQQLVGSTRYFTTQKRGLAALGERAKNLFKTPEQIAKDIQEGYPTALRQIQSDSDKFTENWMYLQENRPEILDSFLELYELSDGKINTIAKMNEDILNSFTNFRPLVDPNPEQPNIIAQAVRSNYYNSLLSAPATAAKALYGNLSGLVAEPVSYFGGALLRGDMKSLQRGWMAYSAIFDTQKKALPYAGQLFTKASQNPNAVKNQSRLDLVIKQETKLEQYRYIAEQEAAQGRSGFKFLVKQYEEMQAMAADPVFRLVPNLFTGFDGWTGATLANAQARFRAMDELERLGEAVTPARVKELATAEYNSMFGSDGLITDKAVKYSNADIALNLDTGLSKQMDGLLQTLPGLTPFLTFPTTMMNIVRVADDYVPAPLRSFQKDVNDLAYTSVQTFMENPESMDRILASRGHRVEMMDEVTKINTLVDLKNRTLGRKAIGTFVTSMVIGSVVKDKLFGDGLFSVTGDGTVDRQLDAARRKNSNFKPRSVVGPGGVRIEYNEVLGPGLSNWVAAVANVADNFDMLGEAYTENAFEKLSFILAAALTDAAGISALRPLVEVMSGNEYAANRFVAGQINALGPLGGMRNEFGRILDGGLKDFNNNIIEQLANRNQFIGLIDQTNRLPTVISPVSGEAPNKYSMLQRIWNTYSPLKIHPAMTKEEKFLYDIEYDVSSAFKKRAGVDLAADERNALNAEMGSMQFFRKEISRIMRTADARNTISELRAIRRKGVPSTDVPIGKYDQIHMMLREAQKKAEELAFNNLDPELRNAIEQRIMVKKINDQRAEQGIAPIPTNRY